MFSPTEMLVEAGLLGSRSVIKAMVKAGELTLLGHERLQASRLPSILDEETPVHEEEHKDKLWKKLESAIADGNAYDFVQKNWKVLWSMIASSWGGCLLEAPWVKRTVFTDVPTRIQHTLGSGPVYDFWPRSQFEDYCKLCAECGDREWLAHRGRRQTATMLGSAQSDEDVAAVWIAAFAFDSNGGGRGRTEDSWRGRVHQLIQALELIAHRYFETRKYLYAWHHGMTHVRPASALNHVYGDALVPKSLHDCISVAALDAILSHALYVPVRIVLTSSSRNAST